MKFRYLPMTDKDHHQMLQTIGINSVEELFSDIPKSVRFQGRLGIPEAMDEYSLLRHMKALSGKNRSTDQLVSFLGAGIYEHYIPSVVNHIIARPEFYTAYTPYQPEISQGELQAIFEFQTMICELTGMDVANASMYDGPTALAEAASLAVSVSKKQKVVISRTVHPEARAILATHAKGLGYEVVEVSHREGVTDLAELQTIADPQTAAVIVQSPNFFGNIEDLAQIEKIAHQHKGLFVVSANPLALGLLKPPGAFGADIVVGDVQPFGIPMAFGGPSCGYFATTKKYMRRIPGRIVGQTVDEEGARGFVLTLQAREQHIRRDKATSNICSNQALMALAASVYMSALGKQGIQEVATLNINKAHFAKQRLAEVPGVEAVFDQPFFNEFVIKVNRPVREVNEKLLAQGILAGYDLGQDYPELENHLLVAVTEIRTKEEIEAFAKGLEVL